METSTTLRMRTREEPAASDGIQQLLESARQTLNMDVAFVTALSGTEQTFTHLNGDAASFGWESGTTIPKADGYCHYVLAGELPNAVPDARNHVLASRLAATAGAGIGSYVGVPITLGSGRVYGALCVTSHSEHQELGASEVAVMNLLSRLIAKELSERERAATARDVEQRELTAWLAPGALEMHLQPITALADGTIRGVEALARFPGHPGSPADIFAAGSRGGMGPLLELVAVRAAIDLLPQLPEPLYLSVNVSPATVAEPELKTLLLTVPGKRIVLELTEHVEFTDHLELVARLRDLKAHGIRIAIDDAGSGYAGLQTIVALAPEILKLDIALIKNLDHDPVRRSLVRALASFASETGAEVVAEGIETQRELDALRELGVTLGQGYLLGRPAPVDTLLASLHTRLALPPPRPCRSTPDIDSVAGGCGTRSRCG